MSGSARRGELPLLVLGPSLGTSADSLWRACAAGLAPDFDVLAWDLPGHGHNRSVPDDPFTIADLARGVLVVVEEVLAQRGEPGASFACAGVSVGGAVTLQLLLDAPDRVTSAVLLCSGARIGDAATWAERRTQVEAGGTAGLQEASAARWFAPGFAERRPEVAGALARALADTSDSGYVAVCRALAGFDVRDRLGEVTAPVLAVSGHDDAVTPPASLREVADGVRSGRHVDLPEVAHLAPAEAPARVAALLRAHLLGEDDHPLDPASPYGVALEHLAGRPGPTPPALDDRTRALLGLGALVAVGDDEALTRQLVAARDAGLAPHEIAAALHATAEHVGVPAATAALRLAARVLDRPAPA